MSSKAKGTANVRAQIAQLVANLASVVPSGTTLKIDGVERTVADIVAELEHYQTLDADVLTKKSVYQASVRARVDAEAGINALLSNLLAALVPLLGKSSVGLETLGFGLSKPRTPLTSEQAKAKADRARKTREQLHTLGSRQKKELKAQIRLQADNASSAGDGSNAVSPPSGKPGSPTA